MIEYLNNEWVYGDTKNPIKNNKRPCIKCGKYSTEEGHDSCIANLPGVKNACCGHGVTQGYLHFEDGRILRFENLEVE